MKDSMCNHPREAATRVPSPERCFAGGKRPSILRNPPLPDATVNEFTKLDCRGYAAELLSYRSLVVPLEVRMRSGHQDNCTILSIVIVEP